ncbi:hypothetical protein GGR56DRAFT_622805 [Xylariaceae sp. FL0804]|nr:hypothetical protein GGR56DRAFT_622805 [Xylariaceae sp. FL0804]
MQCGPGGPSQGWPVPPIPPSGSSHRDNAKLARGRSTSKPSGHCLGETSRPCLIIYLRRQQDGLWAACPQRACDCTFRHDLSGSIATWSQTLLFSRLGIGLGRVVGLVREVPCSLAHATSQSAMCVWKHPPLFCPPWCALPSWDGSCSYSPSPATPIPAAFIIIIASALGVASLRFTSTLFPFSASAPLSISTHPAGLFVPSRIAPSSTLPLVSTRSS